MQLISSACFLQRQVFLTGPKNNPNQLFWMLGLALTLPMILLAGPAAGFAIGYWLTHQFHAPDFVIPAGMGLGLLGSGLQTYRLISRINNRQKEK